MSIKALLALLLLLACTRASHAADPVKTLTKIDYFALGGVGASAHITEAELAFRAILKTQTARRDFLTILKTGTPEGKCYALVALRGLDPNLYATEIKIRKTENDKVNTARGCMVGDEPMTTVARSIDAGYYDAFVKKKP